MRRARELAECVLPQLLVLSFLLDVLLFRQGESTEKNGIVWVCKMTGWHFASSDRNVNGRCATLTLLYIVLSLKLSQTFFTPILPPPSPPFPLDRKLL